MTAGICKYVHACFYVDPYRSTTQTLLHRSVRAGGFLERHLHGLQHSADPAGCVGARTRECSWGRLDAASSPLYGIGLLADDQSGLLGFSCVRMRMCLPHGPWQLVGIMGPHLRDPCRTEPQMVPQAKAFGCTTMRTSLVSGLTPASRAGRRMPFARPLVQSWRALAAWMAKVSVCQSLLGLKDQFM